MFSQNSELLWRDSIWNELFIVPISFGNWTILERAFWEQGVWVYWRGNTRLSVGGGGESKLSWCHRLPDTCWPHLSLTRTVCYHATVRPVSESPFIFLILWQSVNSQFCMDEHRVCCSTACRPVTVHWFSGSEQCTCPEQTRRGNVQGFSIKTVHSHREEKISAECRNFALIS